MEGVTYPAAARRLEALHGMAGSPRHRYITYRSTTTHAADLPTARGRERISIKAHRWGPAPSRPSHRNSARTHLLSVGHTDLWTHLAPRGDTVARSPQSIRASRNVKPSNSTVRCALQHLPTRHPGPRSPSATLHDSKTIDHASRHRVRLFTSRRAVKMRVRAAAFTRKSRRNNASRRLYL